MQATTRQKRTVKALIAEVAVPETFEEASRLIVGLRRQQSLLPPQDVIDVVHAAREEGDKAALGQALRQAKRQTRHGHWLSLLAELGIPPRQAQRIMSER